MYSGTGQEAKKPFTLKQLKKKVWSFDGFCYWLYHQPGAYTKVFQEKNYLDWLSDEVGMIDLVEAIRRLTKSDEYFVAVADVLLDSSPYTAPLNRESVIETFLNMGKMTVEERHRNWGNEAFNLGRYKESLRQYKKAQVKVYTTAITNNMALVYLQLNDYNKAEECFLKALEEDSQPVYRLNLIRLYSIIGQWQLMLTELNQLKKVFESSEMWYYYGMAYEGLSRTEEAITAYAKALEDREDFKVLEDFVRLAEQEKAIDLLKVSMNQPQLPKVDQLYIGAFIAKAEGDEDGYVYGLECAAEVAESSLPYLLKLADYYRNKRQIIKAIMTMEQIDKKEQIRETVQFERSLIAKDAGKTDTYKTLIEQITDSWKSEVRKASGR